MEVRPITEFDIPKVAEAHAEAWKVAFKGILSDKLLSGLTKEKMEKAWEGILKREIQVAGTMELEVLLWNLVWIE